MDENQELEERFAQLTQDLRENNIQAFRNSFLEMHIYEQGQFYQSLTEENRQLIYSYLSPKELADMFEKNKRSARNMPVLTAIIIKKNRKRVVSMRK